VIRALPAVPSRLFLRVAQGAVLSALGSLGCASSPMLRAAEEGHFDGLRAALATELAQGRLGAGEATRFAHAVAKGEIARASGEPGLQRLHELSSCAAEVSGPLDDRADKHDAFGAAVALVLVDAGVHSPGRFSRWASTPPDAPEAAWRALGARSLVSGSDGDLRRRFISDADQEVRRNALHAALEASDPGDTQAVLEAARVDPFPAARQQAIRAAGALGGEQVVIALKDLWPRADELTREAIVDAWAAERSFPSGGRRELEWVVSTQTGLPAILAAGALVRAAGAGAGEAAGTLERAVHDGPTADRIRTIELVPFAITTLRDAVVKAEADPDEAVVAAALARVLETPSEKAARAEIVTRLLPLAAGDGLGAVTARDALAAAHEPQVLHILELRSTAEDAKTRAEAGSAMAALGDLGRAALVATDREPSVRTVVACAILRAAHGR
jgi:HEAT repeats